MDQVIYRREHSSVQAKVGHEELTKIRSRPAGLISLSGRIGSSSGTKYVKDYAYLVIIKRHFFDFFNIREMILCHYLMNV